MVAQEPPKLLVRVRFLTLLPINLKRSYYEAKTQINYIDTTKSILIDALFGFKNYFPCVCR